MSKDLTFLQSASDADTCQAMFFADCGASAQKFLTEEQCAISMKTVINLTRPPSMEDQIEVALKRADLALKDTLSTSISYNPETTVDCNSIEKSDVNVATPGKTDRGICS